MLTQLIPIKNIQASKANARRDYDPAALQGLADSITRVGIIQPLLVTAKGQKFQIISGERRYRAAKLAGLKEVPGVVTEADEGKAHDLRVIENLQREGLHPLEEMKAFVMFIDKFDIGVAEIAERVGRPQAYVTKRLQLASLNADFLKLFQANAINLMMALELSRLEPVVQDHIYEEEFACEEINYPNLLGLRSLIKERLFSKLDGKMFDPEDIALIEGVGPCSKCPSRSGNSPVLFNDMEDPDTCTNLACYQAKAEASYQVNLAKAKQDGLYLLCQHANEESQALKKEGYPVLMCYDDYMVVEETSQGKNIHKGFVVSGWTGKGETQHIELIGKAEKKAPANGSTGEAPMDSLDTQMANIELREARARELDREKIQLRLIDFMADVKQPLSDEDKIQLLETANLTGLMAFVLFELGIDWQYKGDLIKRLQDEAGDAHYIEHLINNPAEYVPDLILSAYREKFTQKGWADPEKNPAAKAFYLLSAYLRPKETAQARADQGAIAEKRQARVTERLNKLAKDLNREKKREKGKEPQAA